MHLYPPSQVPLINGRLHWVTRPRRYSPRCSIISFDLADDQFQEVQHLIVRIALNMHRYHLVVIIGSCLSAAVYCNYEILEIWVLKKYGVGESWNKKFCIGNYVPIGLEKDEDQYFEILKITSKRRFVNSSFTPLDDRR